MLNALHQLYDLNIVFLPFITLLVAFRKKDKKKLVELPCLQGLEKWTSNFYVITGYVEGS